VTLGLIQTCSQAIKDELSNKRVYVPSPTYKLLEKRVKKYKLMKYDYKDNYLSFDNVFSYLGSFPTKRRRGKHKSKTETTPQISTKRNRANTTKSSKSQSIICTLLKTKYMLNIFLFITLINRK